MSDTKEMEGLLKSIVTALVDYPEKVEISTIEGASTWVLELKVGQGDVGKVIGKQGKNAAAIRTIMSAAGGKEKVNIIVQIVEPPTKSAAA